MKKYIYAFATVVALCTLSCSKDTEIQNPEKPEPVDPIVPTEKSAVLTGNVDATKVTSDNNGIFLWQASDVITIITDNGNNREFTAEAAGLSSDFSGHIPNADELIGGYAIYPPSSAHEAADNILSFELPSVIKWNADASNMPMFSKIVDNGEGDPKASFKAIGGVLKLICYNIPSGATKLSFISASKKIAGAFLFDADDAVPTINGEDSSSDAEKTIVIDFSENYSSSKVFYIPLPVVTLTGGFTVKITDSGDSELFSITSSAAPAITRNKLMIAPALNCGAAPSDATLTNSEIVAAAWSSGSYVTSSITNSSGTWNFNAAYAGNYGKSGNYYMQLRNNSTVSYLQLPDFSNDISSIILHGVCNASETQYSGSIYFRENADNSEDPIATAPSASSAQQDLTMTIPAGYSTGYIMVSGPCKIAAFTVKFRGEAYTAPSITANDNALTIGVGQSSASTTVSLANAIDGLGISALVSGTDAENFTAAIDGTTLTVTAKAANTTAADKVATVTLKASGASSKAISVTQTSCLVPNPTDLTAIAGDAEVDVTWTGDAHATSYVAYLHTAATATPATGGTNITSSISNSGTNYKIEDYSSVDNDQTYYLYIKVNGVASSYVAPTDYAVVSFTPAQAKGTAENPYLASEAYDIVSAYASGEGPTGTIYVKGYVSTAYNPSSNSQTYFISDDGSTNKQFEAYSGKGISGADITDANKVRVGDWIVACGTAKNYSGTTPEFVAGSTIITHNPKLAAPEFTPAAGTYYSAQSVAISATNSATIYYTTDGTDPDENSDEYEEPIAVSADMTIKAIAVKANFVNSAVASAAYDIEAPTKLGTPVISVDSYNHNSIAFSWAAVDNATGYQVSTDGGSNWLTKQEETSYTWTGLSASTSYTIKVKAIGTDNGQYTDSDVASKSQTTSAPVTLVSIALTTAPTKTTYNVGETFSFAGAVVTATYSDANTADVTASCTTDYDGVTFNTTGVKTVTVSYTEGSTQTTTFNVTVAIVDVLTYSGLSAGMSGTAAYKDFSGKSGGSSDAIYAGQIYYSSTISYIQLRATSPSGIVSTTSGGTVKKVTVTWSSNSAIGRTLDIYGKNTAYSSGADLYSADASTKGTLVGSIINGTSTSYTFTSDYEYIGLRSNASSMYFDEIEIEWAEGDPTIAMVKTSILGVAAAGVNNASESGVYTFKGGATDADVTVTCDGEIVTSASKNNGSLTYTVAANTGAAREGWIKVQYASESAHTVTVSQNAATYTLTLSSGGNGTVAATVDDAAVASGSAVAVGKTVSITTTPSSGYQLASLSYNDGSAHDIISTKSFTMPSAAVTVSATFSAVPTIGINKSSITNVAAAGVTNASESGVYSFYNGATDADVTVTCDGTIVTAASKNNGALTYTVASNSGAARDGWIKVQYGTEDPHTITVSQLAGATISTTTITYENFTNTSYNTSESTFTHDTFTFGYVNAMRNGSNGTPSGWAKNQVIQTKNTSKIYNKTSMGSITKIRVYTVTNTNSFTITSGSSMEPTTNSVTRPATPTGTESITYSSYANKTVTPGQTTTANYYDFNISNQNYFKIAPGGSLYIYKIEITYSN